MVSDAWRSRKEFSRIPDSVKRELEEADQAHQLRILSICAERQVPENLGLKFALEHPILFAQPRKAKQGTAFNLFEKLKGIEGEWNDMIELELIRKHLDFCARRARGVQRPPGRREVPAAGKSAQRKPRCTGRQDHRVQVARTWS
jgi:hypothetical protein